MNFIYFFFSAFSLKPSVRAALKNSKHLIFLYDFFVEFEGVEGRRIKLKQE